MMVTDSSPFLNPMALPTRSLDTMSGPVLVVAPHPDDETLGCGGAIALLRASGCRVQVLVVSDGTLSHPRSRKYPAPQLRALRQAESVEALSTLGVREATEITFLQLPDGSIPIPQSSRFRAAVDGCYRTLKALLPTAIFLPWRFDPHPDHRATWHLMRAALADAARVNLAAPRIIEYPIWDWDPDQRRHIPDALSIEAWKLDIQPVLETKRQAIAAYRSQTTNLIDDDPEGFRLTPAMLANFARPWEIYLEEMQ